MTAMGEDEAAADRKRVLIVDDHDAFRSAVRLMLEVEGFAVVGEAADGAGAVAQNERLRPDLVLLDVQLPDVDGFAVAEQLAALPFPPVVALVSTRPASTYGLRVATAPVVGFLTKSQLSGDALLRLLG